MALNKTTIKRGASVYKRLKKILGKAPETVKYMKIENEPYERFVFEKIGKDTYSIAHYYEQNGDLVPDPDITFVTFKLPDGYEKLVGSKYMIIPLTFQNNMFYNEVAEYLGNGQFKMNTSGVGHLLSFMDDWTKNLIRQGFPKGKKITK